MELQNEALHKSCTTPKEDRVVDKLVQLRSVPLHECIPLWRTLWGYNTVGKNMAKGVNLHFSNVLLVYSRGGTGLARPESPTRPEPFFQAFLGLEAWNTRSSLGLSLKKKPASTRNSKIQALIFCDFLLPWNICLKNKPESAIQS